MKLAIAAVLAQAADLVTMDPAREQNPIAMHPAAYVAKALLIVVLILWVRVEARYQRGVLVVALVTGLLGVYSNRP